MKKIKTAVAWLVISILVLSAFAGCSLPSEGEGLTVICTVFPIYDWVKNVVGECDGIEVKLLVSGGADLHSYQPSVDDVIELRSADVVIRVGGVDDSFVGDLMAKGGSGVDLRLIDADGITLAETSDSSEHESHHEHEHEHEHNVDEHIWLSFENAAASVKAICETMSEIDGENASIFKVNADRYIEELGAINAIYRETVESAEMRKMIFADRFPFVYMTEEYGIEYEAAFAGCNTEAEADFETVIRLSERADQWNAKYICITESSDRRLAEGVIRATAKGDAEIVVFDSMQSVTEKEISAGETYLKIAEKNLAALKYVLSAEK